MTPRAPVVELREASKFFGSIVTKQGIIEAGGGPAGTPDIWFDVCLKDKCWPPPSLKLPRVVPTSWESDM